MSFNTPLSDRCEFSERGRIAIGKNVNKGSCQKSYLHKKSSDAPTSGTCGFGCWSSGKCVGLLGTLYMRIVREIIKRATIILAAEKFSSIDIHPPFQFSSCNHLFLHAPGRIALNTWKKNHESCHCNTTHHNPSNVLAVHMCSVFSRVATVTAKDTALFIHSFAMFWNGCLRKFQGPAWAVSN